MACRLSLSRNGRNREEIKNMRNGSRTWMRTAFRALVFVGVIWLLCVGILANQATPTMKRSSGTTGSFNLWKLIDRERRPVRHDLNLNYVSKRQVPNGPDPIHNRRASQARQPPGQT